MVLLTITAGIMREISEIRNIHYDERFDAANGLTTLIWNMQYIIDEDQGQHFDYISIWVGKTSEKNKSSDFTGGKWLYSISVRDQVEVKTTIPSGIEYPK